jgi:hypothetical protein
MVTGPRQCGKTTLVRDLVGGKREFIYAEGRSPSATILLLRQCPACGRDPNSLRSLGPSGLRYYNTSFDTRK